MISLQTKYLFQDLQATPIGGAKTDIFDCISPSVGQIEKHHPRIMADE
jgi:hypothetical protein